MRNVITLIFVARIVLAGTIEIKICTYDQSENRITEIGSMTSTWQPPKKNRTVFEYERRGGGAISFGGSEEHYMYYKLRAETQSDLVPFPKRLFQKRFRFTIDDNDKSFAENDIIFRFEETIPIDSSKNLFTIRYFALNKQELHEKYGKTKGGLDLNKIDPRGDAKMIISENDDMVGYWVFFFHDDNPPQPSEAEKIYEDVHSQISAPFVYAVQYQNYNDTKTFDRLSQDSPFTIHVAEGKDVHNEKSRNFKANLHCIILPQKYENDKLGIEFKITNRLSSYSGGDDGGSSADHGMTKSLEFEKDDIIQIILPSDWPGKYYRTAKGWSNRPSTNGAKHKPVFDPDVGKQYITIRPIKIQ